MTSNNEGNSLDEALNYKTRFVIFFDTAEGKKNLPLVTHPGSGGGLCYYDSGPIWPSMYKKKKLREIMIKDLKKLGFKTESRTIKNDTIGELSNLSLKDIE